MNKSDFFMLFPFSSSLPSNVEREQAFLRLISWKILFFSALRKNWTENFMSDKRVFFSTSISKALVNFLHQIIEVKVSLVIRSRKPSIGVLENEPKSGHIRYSGIAGPSLLLSGYAGSIRKIQVRQNFRRPLESGYIGVFANRSFKSLLSALVGLARPRQQLQPGRILSSI